MVLLVAGLASLPALCSADDPSPRAQEPAADSAEHASGLYLKVRLSSPVKMSKLQPGDVVAGTLSRDVYSADRKLFSGGSDVRLTVDHTAKRKRARNDHWPWVVKVFTPRHESYPVFKNATVTQAAGQHSQQTSLRVSLISASRMREVRAKGKKDKSGQPSSAENVAVEASPSSTTKTPTPTLVLEAFGIEDALADNKNDTDAVEPDSAEHSSASATIPAGTRCKILLLSNVSASKSKPGDAVQSRLLEPVLLNSMVVLPAGALIEGKVVKKTPPRMLSRAGSLYLTFTELTLPGGDRLPIAASLAGAELEERSHTKMDAEGRLHGERPGKAWMAINLGMTAGVAKEVDDGLQLVIEAIVSTATDASTAGVARIVASCASGVYIATRHGRDVILPRFTEMDISLDRPLSLNSAAASRSPAAAAPVASSVSGDRSTR